MPERNAQSSAAAREALKRGGRRAAPFERNMHTFVAGEIGRDIVGGVHPPGALLPSSLDLCARYAVSRTALREALSVLNAKSLIVARPKIGTRVRPRAEWNLLDPEVLAWHMQSAPMEAFIDELYVMRQMVEPTAAALAAGLHSPGLIERIADAYARMERFRHGAGDLVQADIDFHLSILNATGNHFLAALGGMIQASLECTFKLSWLGASRIQDDRLHQHLAILEAIREGAVELARTRMADLLSGSIGDVRDYMLGRDGKVPGRGG